MRCLLVLKASLSPFLAAGNVRQVQAGSGNLRQVVLSGQTVSVERQKKNEAELSASKEER